MRRRLAWLALLPALLPWPADAHAASDRPVAIPEAQYFIESYRQEAVPPRADDGRWIPLSLSRPVHNPSQALVRVWFRLTFRVDRAGNEPWAVMLPRLYTGGRVFLNGVPVGEVESATPETQVSWLRPLYFPLPAHDLRPGDNTLLVATDSRYPTVGLGAPVVGPLEAVQPLYQKRLFWEYAMVPVAVWPLLVGGLFMLAIWYMRRQEVLYAMFGLAMLAWGIRSIHHVWPVVPLDIWPYWRAVFYAGTGYGDVLLCLFVLRIAGFQKAWVERSVLVYAAIGPVAMLLMGQSFLRWDTIWYAGAMPLNVFAAAMSVRAAWRTRAWDTVALAVALGVGIGAFVWDYAVKAGWLSFSNVYLAHLATPMIMLAMGGVLLARFVDALGKVENMNVELERRVKQREAQLTANHEALRRLEAEQASAAERQRIMQDMHDGLGSQLLSSLAMVERGAAGKEEIAGVLRECIDDMRLVIDALAPGDNDLLAALGSLRFRLEPRLKAAGIALDWRIACPADTLDVEPREGLAVLRILQEAIANVLKHAGANRLTVTISADDHALDIRIADNGRGFAPQAAGAGRGLAHMRKRADAIGATLEIASAAAGTEIRLHKPLPGPIPAETIRQ